MAHEVASPPAAFRRECGQDRLGTFESAPGRLRRFCTACGSWIVAERVAEPYMLLRPGCLDAAIVAQSPGHIWRSDGACWYDPADHLPAAPEGLPARA